jgi:hypothetical protein
MMGGISGISLVEARIIRNLNAPLYSVVIDTRQLESDNIQKRQSFCAAPINTFTLPYLSTGSRHTIIFTTVQHGYL